MIRKGGKGEEPASSNAPSLAWRRDGSCGFALPNEQPFGKGHSSPPKTHATTRVTDSSPPSARPGTPRGTARPVGATRTPRRTTRGRVKGIAIRRRLVVAPSSNVSCLYPPFSLASPYASSRRQCASHRCRAILRGSGMKGRSIDRYRDRDSESDLRSIDRVRQARRTAPAALQQQQPKALCAPCVSHHSIACAACFCHLAGKAKYVRTHTRASKRAAKDSHRRTYQRTRTRCMHACTRPCSSHTARSMLRAQLGRVRTYSRSMGAMFRFVSAARDAGGPGRVSCVAKLSASAGRHCRGTGSGAARGDRR